MEIIIRGIMGLSYFLLLESINPVASIFLITCFIHNVRMYSIADQTGLVTDGPRMPKSIFLSAQMIIFKLVFEFERYFLVISVGFLK